MLDLQPSGARKKKKIEKIKQAPVTGLFSEKEALHVTCNVLHVTCCFALLPTREFPLTD